MSKYSEQEVEALLDKMKAISEEYDRELDTYNRGKFKSKYGERLGAYSDKLKALNGDDFDIVDSAYDEHNSDYSDLTDDEYVDALEENIKSVIARIWPEASEEEVAEATEEIKDAVETEEVANEEGVESTEEDLATSDETQKKRTTGPWGNPSTSGGRTGKCGIVNGGKKPDGTATSDEKQKKSPEEEAEDKLEDAVKAVSKANPAAEILVEAATAKPSDVENPDKKEESKLSEAYTFSKKDPLYRMSH